MPQLVSIVTLKSDEGKLMPLRWGKVVSQDGEVCRVEKYAGHWKPGNYNTNELKVLTQIYEYAHLQ